MLVWEVELYEILGIKIIGNTNNIINFFNICMYLLSKQNDPHKTY